MEGYVWNVGRVERSKQFDLSKLGIFKHCNLHFNYLKQTQPSKQGAAFWKKNVVA